MRAQSPGRHAEGTWVELARDAARRGEAREAPALPASYSLAGSPGGAGAGAVHAQRLVVFRLDGALYALPVERVREIVRLRPITPVPRVPAAVRGVISLRGQVIQVIDLRARLALPPAEQGREAAAQRAAGERSAGPRQAGREAAAQRAAGERSVCRPAPRQPAARQAGRASEARSEAKPSEGGPPQRPEARSEPQASEDPAPGPREALRKVDRRARIVVAHDGDGRVAGVLVDGVEEVVTVAEEAFCDVPGGAPAGNPPAGAWAVEGLCRLRGRFVSVVDLDWVMALDAGA
jgi:chemotaxis signal transduction protein